MKTSATLFLSLLLCSIGFAQPMFITRNGQISFFSKTPMENIEAVNNDVTSLFNSGTGEIVFAVLIKSFHFERALMEEHFNENYLESDKFPKSTFQGKLTNLSEVDMKKDGTYMASVEGDLTIHGVKQHVVNKGEVIIQKGKISVTATFVIKLADYQVEIPSLVADKISESLEIKVNCKYEPKS